jgi:hypothetical protein
MYRVVVAKAEKPRTWTPTKIFYLIVALAIIIGGIYCSIVMG